MPRKTTAKSETSTDGISKPKKRAPRAAAKKTKSASEDITSEAVSSDLVSEPTPAPIVAEPEFTPEPIAEAPDEPMATESSVSNNVVGSTGAMSDIMPKPAPAPLEEMAPPPVVLNDLPVKPVSSPADTSFLKSEDYNFGLKEKKSGNWVTRAAYILGTLIVLMLIALGVMTYLNHKNLNSTDQTPVVDNTPTNTTPDTNTPQIPASTAAKYTISGPTGEYIQKVQSAIGNKVADLTFDSTTTNTLPTLTEDTILFKSAASDKANALLAQLTALGIKPKLQESADITSDIAVYLTPTTKNVDLSGLTAGAYNASGKTGLAKAYCDNLKAYKVNTCTALNYTGSAPTGLQFYSKNANLYFMLKRTAEFKDATFNAAQSGQVEDIKLVIGK